MIGSTQKEIAQGLRQRAKEDKEGGDGLAEVIEEGIELQELQCVQACVLRTIADVFSEGASAINS